MTVLRRLLAADPASHERELGLALALALHNLGLHCQVVGRTEDAVAAARTSVDIFRRRLPDDPARLTSRLALALTSLSSHLEELGQPSRRWWRAGRRFAIQRELAAHGPGAHAGELPAALTCLSAHIALAGRYEKALAAAEESVALQRAIVEREPHPQRRGRLAFSLNNLSSRLDDVGRSHDALSASEEAIAILTELADAYPRRYESDLDACLRNLALRHASAGRIEEVRAAVDARFDRAELAAGVDATPSEVRPNLPPDPAPVRTAATPDDDLTAADEAVSVLRRLAATNPAAYEPALAAAEEVLADRGGHPGPPDDAKPPARAVPDHDVVVGGLLGIPAARAIAYYERESLAREQRQPTPYGNGVELRRGERGRTR